MTTHSSDGTPTPSASGPRASSEYARAAWWRPSDAAHESARFSLASCPPQLSAFSFLLSAFCVWCLLSAFCSLLSALCFLLSAFCLCLLYATFCYPDLCSLLSAFCSILSTFFFSFCSRQSVGVSTAPGLLRAFTPFFSSYHTHSPAPFGPRPHWAVVL